MKSKAKKVVLIIITVLIVLIIAAAAAAWAMFGQMIQAAGSITEMEDGLYSMEYNGDYGFDDFLEQGGAVSDSDVASYLIQFLSHGYYQIETEVEGNDFGCSTICTESENGGVLFGRNFDWEVGDVLLVHTRPENGYESTSTCALNFLGFGNEYAPDGSMAERMQTLAAIYVPLDGMNEKGLMVADLMAGDDEITRQQTDKTDLTTTTAIRLLLDRAATVDEAVNLLREYDMNSSADAAHHLSIADADGVSVVVEYVNGEMIVTDTKVVTNHYLGDSEKKDIGSEQSHIRYERLMQHSGTADRNCVRDLMSSVAQMNFAQTPGQEEKTLWSVVYDPQNLSADFYYSEDFETCHQLKLGQKGHYLE